MARDFSKNTSNYLSLPAGNIGAGLNGTRAISIAAWVYADTLTGGSDNDYLINVWCASFAQLKITLSDMRGQFYNPAAVGAIPDRYASSALTTGVWTHICFTYSVYAYQTPDCYINGVLSNGSGTWEIGGSAWGYSAYAIPDSIGCKIAASTPTNTSQQFDGKIADLAIWTGNIGIKGAQQLAAGCSPLRILPAVLLAHWPLWGEYSPDIDLIRKAQANVSGSVPKIDGPISIQQF